MIAFKRSLRLLLALSLLLAACAGEALALEGFGGFIEYGFTAADQHSTDPTGVTTNSSSQFFVQRYNLSLERQLFPLLTLSTGVIFEHDASHTSSDTGSTSGSSTQLSPSATLNLANTVMPSSVGYSRRETRAESNGVSSPASILESYTAHTNINYPKLPPISLSYSYFESYDEQRISHDLVSQNVLWNTSLQPIDKLGVGYQGSWTTSENLLNHVTSDTFSNTGRVGWSDNLWKNRVSYSTNYSLSSLTTSVSSSGAGEVFSAQTPTTGLSGTSSLTTIPPVTATTGQLSANPALASGGAVINLVSATTPPAGTIIQMGLDFGFGATVSVNTLYLTIASGSNARPDNLAQIAIINQLFSFDLYTSSDGVNWSLVQSSVSQRFGNDPTGLSDTVGYTLTLPATLNARFLKVVVTPVAASTLLPYSSIQGIDIRSIAVTRMQAYAKRSAQSFPKGSATSLAGQFGLNASARLLDDPGLSYDLAFGFSHSSNAGQPLATSWFLTNGLGMEKQLTPIVNTNAHVSLQQQSGNNSTQTSVSYSAAMSLVPLPTLTHSLTYSGGVSGVGDKSSIMSNAVYLTNTAQLYTGISFAISGGYSSSSSSEGLKNDSVNVSSGLSVAPRRDFSFSLSYAESSSKTSGGPTGGSSAATRSGGVTAAYTPVPAFYISGAFTASSGTGQPFTTAESFAMSWAPFRGGALTLNINYSESLTTPDNEKSRSVSPTVRWKVSPRVTLDLNYQYFRVDSPAAGVSEGSSTGATLRLLL